MAGASGSADLEVEGQAQIAQMAATLVEISRQIPAEINWVLRVDGHTDAVPIYTAKFPSNWELSAARAARAVRYLQSAGVDAGRLNVVGYGAQHPVADNDDAEARARNRRIEIAVQPRDIYKVVERK